MLSVCMRARVCACAWLCVCSRLGSRPARVMDWNATINIADLEQSDAANVKSESNAPTMTRTSLFHVTMLWRQFSVGTSRGTCRPENTTKSFTNWLILPMAISQQLWIVDLQLSAAWWLHEMKRCFLTWGSQQAQQPEDQEIIAVQAA